MYLDSNLAKTLNLINLIKEAVTKYGIEDLMIKRRADDFNQKNDACEEIDELINLFYNDTNDR